MSASPKALLFITNSCPHCPGVMQSLTGLVKSGELGQLEIINLQQSPDLAQQHNVRSVPWLKLGPFELTGQRTKGDIQQWIKRIGDNNAMGDYFVELMLSGEINKVQQLIEEKPETFPALINLIAETDSNLSARVGAGAVIEGLAGTDLLKQHIPLLAELSQHETASIRNDACYYLGLSQDILAKPYIETLLNDADSDVKETAIESLENINRLT
jgi:thioredoxin-like negative regulator of GroEL